MGALGREGAEDQEWDRTDMGFLIRIAYEPSQWYQASSTHASASASASAAWVYTFYYVVIVWVFFIILLMPASIAAKSLGVFVI